MGDKKQQPLRHKPLLELATAQHGVVSTRQLAGIGYTRSSASKAHGVGRLRRVHRGVYAVGHVKLSWEGRCFAALLACAPSVASHLSAGWLWGLLRYRPTTFHLTAPTKRRSKPGIAVHSSVLAEGDLAVVGNLPLTALPRTILDLASLLSETALERMLERAEEHRRFDLGAFDELLGRTAGHPGHGALRRALDIYRPESAFTRSGLERRFLELVRRAGLPEPSMNYVVGGFELDAYWEAERFVVELDVYETHGSHAAFERDRIRQEDLLLLGIGMTRVTGPRLEREPRKVMARIATLLEQRRNAR